jgi:hypothetical protein
VEGRRSRGDDADGHKHPHLQTARQHQRQSEERGEAIGEVGRDHDLLAVVPVGPGASQRAAKHERDGEAQIESGEGERELGFLLRRGIEHLCEIDVQRKPSHATANDGH